jgi:hypothetical protein
MQTSQTNALVSGAIVMWDCGATEHETLMAKLTYIGLEDFCPPPRSKNEALRCAMGDYAGQQKKLLVHNGRKKDLIIQPLKGRDDGLEMVEVARGQTDNDYTSRFSAKIEGENEQVTVTSGSAPSWLIQESYAKYRAEVTGGAVGSSLVNILQHLHGTCVRQIGGVYYLPEDAVAKWDEVVTAYESAGPNRVNRTRIVLDDQAIRMVKQAITRELTTAAGQIAEEVRQGDLGEKALENRKESAQKLRERAKLYEGILSTQLAECRAVIDLAETAASSAVAVQDSGNCFDDMYAVK